MGIKRKQHSAEFKARVAMAALSGEKTLAELSAEFGVHPTMISDWKQELVKRAGELFARGNRAPAVGDAQKVIDDLHRKIGQLQVERDFLARANRVRETVERLVAEHEPDVVGLSVMTFQRKTAKGIIDLVRTRRPRARIVVGGYDPSLAPEAYTEDPDGGVDFIIPGDGEITFRELLGALEAQRGYDHIAGLSYRTADGIRHNPARGVSGLEDDDIQPPRRDVRVLEGYTLLGRRVDVIETSRGCTFDCSFCSIIEMRGRNFHTYSFERVLADIRDARDRGARSLFIVDDNITLNVRRFEALCRAIIDAGLNDLEYTVQAMTSAIANHGERLARLMREAGFRYVFLGIENILEEDLRFLRAESKNRERENGRKSGNATLKAIDHLHRNKMIVVGGLIVGSPGDTRESVEANLEFARRYVDWPYIQHPTPYPGTPMTKDFRDRGLIINERLEEYDGTRRPPRRALGT